MAMEDPPSEQARSPSGGCCPCGRAAAPWEHLWLSALCVSWLQERHPCPISARSCSIPGGPLPPKAKLSVWEEQISDGTGPFMLSDMKFHAEYEIISSSVVPVN